MLLLLRTACAAGLSMFVGDTISQFLTTSNFSLKRAIRMASIGKSNVSRIKPVHLLRSS